MSISDSKKTDFLWKKLIYGVTETSTDGKAGPNETIASPLPVYGHNVYAESNLIPSTAPASDAGVVKVFTTTSAVHCKEDATVSGKKSWIAVVDVAQAADEANRIADWIAPTFGVTYALKVYAGDPNAGGTELNPLATNEEWVFDYVAGVLHFPNNLPSDVNTNDIYIEGYQYIGTKGVSSGSGGGSSSRIEDTSGADTYVDTEGGTDIVVIGAAGNEVAHFASDVPTDNEHIVVTTKDGEVEIATASTTTTKSVNLRLNPQEGDVFFGDPTEDAILKADADRNIHIIGGDGTTASGNVYIRGGAGATDGKVVVSDSAEKSIVEFIGTTTPVNYIEIKNAPTGERVSIKATGDGTDADVGLLLEPTGYGRIRLGDDGTGYSIVDAPDGAMIWMKAGDSTGGANPAQPIILAGGNGDSGDGSDVLLRGGASVTGEGGQVRLQDAAGQDVIIIDGYNNAVNWFEIRNTPDGFPLEIFAANADPAADVDIGFQPKNNGQVLLPAAYVEVEPNSVTTKAYVDQAITDATSGSGSGDAGVLGTPTDGDLTDGRSGKAPAITSWISGTTTVTDAVDGLNELLGLLVPPVPDDLSAKTLSVSGTSTSRSGASILFSDGGTNNSGATVAAGSQVARTGSSTVTSGTISDFGSGNSGTLEAIVNGVTNGSIAIDENNNTGTDLSLTITANGDYPVDQPGFWQSLSARISGSVSAGVNTYQMSHSETGTTNEVVFVYDDMSSAPTVSGTTVTETTSSLAYSSGVPHYDTSSTLDVSGILVSNLAGQTYLSEGIVQVSSTPSVGSIVNVDPGSYGFPAILPAGFAGHTVNNVPFVIGGNTHTTANIRARGRNAASDGSYNTNGTNINVMSGTPSATSSGPIMEMNVPVESGLGTGSGNAGRVVMNSGDTPADDKTALTAPDWNSSASLASYDAAVVGGVLRNDVTDYSTYLPAGPDLSFSQDADQYVTFMFIRSSVSQFKIQVTGSYTGCWVKIPGIADTTTSNNGWWDMFSLYAGVGVPGDATGNGSNGCAVGSTMNGSSGAFTCSFGTESSSNAANNIIMVRFKLTSGQSITGLSFDRV